MCQAWRRCGVMACPACPAPAPSLDDQRQLAPACRLCWPQPGVCVCLHMEAWRQRCSSLAGMCLGGGGGDLLPEEQTETGAGAPPEGGRALQAAPGLRDREQSGAAPSPGRALRSWGPKEAKNGGVTRQGWVARQAPAGDGSRAKVSRASPGGCLVAACGAAAQRRRCRRSHLAVSGGLCLVWGREGHVAAVVAPPAQARSGWWAGRGSAQAAPHRHARQRRLRARVCLPAHQKYQRAVTERHTSTLLSTAAGQGVGVAQAQVMLPSGAAVAVAAAAASRSTTRCLSLPTPTCTALMAAPATHTAHPS